MAQGRIQTKPLISKTAPLSEGQAMFDALHKGDPSLMKIVLHPQRTREMLWKRHPRKEEIRGACALDGGPITRWFAGGEDL